MLQISASYTGLHPLSEPASIKFDQLPLCGCYGIIRRIHECSENMG
ncbi:Uncharacterised protein [Mycobacteroides abscessus subsp. abscessus]|nr:Uncharacterised protein [Mycobacteroides abscessus subsp. abscessus]